jgi:hypothetical protein
MNRIAPDTEPELRRTELKHDSSRLAAMASH